MAAGNERGSARRGVLGVAAAVALVGVYLGIAAAAHLTPWRAPGGSPPSSASSHSPAAPAAPVSSSGPSSPSGPSGSSGLAPATLGPSAPLGAQELLALIPSGVRVRGCPVGKLLLGAIAVRNCSGVSYGPGQTDAQVSYYLFADNVALDRAYAEFLVAAHVQRGAGNCAGFTSFRAPCETAINNTNPVMTGRAVEFTHAGESDIVSSDEQRHVLVYITARDGQAMVTWWVHPRQWLVTG